MNTSQQIKIVITKLNLFNTAYHEARNWEQIVPFYIELIESFQILNELFGAEEHVK